MINYFHLFYISSKTGSVMSVGHNINNCCYYSHNNSLWEGNVFVLLYLCWSHYEYRSIYNTIDHKLLLLWLSSIKQPQLNIKRFLKSSLFSIQQSYITVHLERWLTFSFLLALNFLKQSTVSCLCTTLATRSRCCGKTDNIITTSDNRHHIAACTQISSGFPDLNTKFVNIIR